MYGNDTVALPATGAGVMAGTAAFAGYTMIALILAAAFVLLVVAGATIMRDSR